MKTPKHHYSNYLISVQFENGFVPDTLDGKIEYCKNFLENLGNLARKSGKRLYANYSVVSGVIGYHAHFAVSWLPTTHNGRKNGVKRTKSIERFKVIDLLERNFFYSDNHKQAIKRVTHDKNYVTMYVIEQPKDLQNTIFSDFYIHSDFVPTYSETKIMSYCSKHQFVSTKIIPQTGCINKSIVFLYMMSISLFVISTILLSLF